MWVRCECQARIVSVSFVNLVSAALTRRLIGVMAKEEGGTSHPLFIDYGQRAAAREWNACQIVHARLALPAPSRMDLSGFGRRHSERLDVRGEGPEGGGVHAGRNLIFLVMGPRTPIRSGRMPSPLACYRSDSACFPDQRAEFRWLRVTRAICEALGRNDRVLTPLFEFSKADVVVARN